MNYEIENAHLLRLDFFSRLNLFFFLLGLIVSSALVIWKGLMCITGSESPVVVVLSESMEPGFARVSIESTWFFVKSLFWDFLGFEDWFIKFLAVGVLDLLHFQFHLGYLLSLSVDFLSKDVCFFVFFVFVIFIFILLCSNA